MHPNANMLYLTSFIGGTVSAHGLWYSSVIRDIPGLIALKVNTCTPPDPTTLVTVL